MKKILYIGLAFSLILASHVFAQPKISEIFFGSGVGQVTEENGYRREYYESGELLSETNCFDDDDDGVYREYYENGQLKMEVFYKSGQREGLYQDYCEDGILRLKFEYKNNKRDGIYKLYYNSGALEAEGLYEDGKEVGVHNVYYENGNLAASANYDEGHEQGVAETYYEDGTIWEEFSYKDGLRDGEYREYHPNGYVKREIIYDKGNIVRVNNYDDERELFLQVLERKLDAPFGEHKQRNVLKSRCQSELLGVEFLCEPYWKLERKENFLKVTISIHPRVVFTVEETDQTIGFMHQLSRKAIEEMDRYAKGFAIERITYCNRETIKVKGYAKDNLNKRLSDFYLLDHLKLHMIRFSVEPKANWKDYKFLIKDVSDSFIFKHEGKEIIFFNNGEASGDCSDIIP